MYVLCLQHRIWSSPDKISQTTYALRVGKDVVDGFQEEFDMNYHLPKLDQIAVPDFPSGAMEHWGLITYRETALLYDEDAVSSYGKERVALVISHELAHNVSALVNSLHVVRNQNRRSKQLVVRLSGSFLERQLGADFLVNIKRIFGVKVWNLPKFANTWKLLGNVGENRPLLNSREQLRKCKTRV